MVEQIKLVNMARHLIRICGFVPEKDISITFVGLRPGEKLLEDLVGMDEAQELLTVDKSFVVRSGGVSRFNFLLDKISELERAAIQEKSESVIHLLREIDPTFRPVDSEVSDQFTNL